MRKSFSAKLKAQVVLETIKNASTIPQISQKYGVHPMQIQRWKAEALSKLKLVFGQSQPSAVDEKYVEALEGWAASY